MCSPPVLTFAVTGLTAVVAGLAFLDPALQAALRRDPEALQNGAWWRLLSPLLVRTDSWLVLVTILAGTVVAGAIVESETGRLRWLALYLGGGIAGQAAGYAWDPHGAGSSVAMLGLFAWIWYAAARSRGRLDQRVRLVGVLCISVLAALTGAALSPNSPMVAVAAAAIVGAVGVNVALRLPGPATSVLLGGGALVTAIALTFAQDNHGPAVLAGLVVSGLVDPHNMDGVRRRVKPD